jgi:hypothetical protein
VARPSAGLRDFGATVQLSVAIHSALSFASAGPVLLNLFFCREEHCRLTARAATGAVPKLQDSGSDQAVGGRSLKPEVWVRS